MKNLVVYMGLSFHRLDIDFTDGFSHAFHLYIYMVVRFGNPKCEFFVVISFWNKDDFLHLFSLMVFHSLVRTVKVGMTERPNGAMWPIPKR